MVSVPGSIMASALCHVSVLLLHLFSFGLKLAFQQSQKFPRKSKSTLSTFDRIVNFFFHLEKSMTIPSIFKTLVVLFRKQFHQNNVQLSVPFIIKARKVCHCFLHEFKQTNKYIFYCCVFFLSFTIVYRFRLSSFILNLVHQRLMFLFIVSMEIATLKETSIHSNYSFNFHCRSNEGKSSENAWYGSEIIVSRHLIR